MIEFKNWGSSASYRHKILTKFFGELPMVEATGDLLITVQQRDIESAGTNAYDCALAQTCKRMYGSDAAIFVASIAYIDMLDAKGRRVIMRFGLSRQAMRLIRDNDARRTVKPATLKLLAIKKSRTIKYSREHSKKRRTSAAYRKQDQDRRNAARHKPPSKRTPAYLARVASVRAAAGIMYG